MSLGNRVGRTLTTEVWAWLLTASIQLGSSSIKYVMSPAPLIINKKHQTTDIVITYAPQSGLTMELPAHIVVVLMVELLVTALKVDVKAPVSGN